MDLTLARIPFINTFTLDFDSEPDENILYNVDAKISPSIRIQPTLLFNYDHLKTRTTIEIAETPDFLKKSHIIHGYSHFNFKENYLLKEHVISEESTEETSEKVVTVENVPIRLKFAVLVNKDLAPKKLEDVIRNPAWTWKFELDAFQKLAIIGLEQESSVFVAAHTSAGKTVVAEYAIAMCFNKGRRVVYTSPVKALSNQKYRDFKSVFGPENVGLLTGDIKANTDGYILVMTTEILHNMLKNQCKTLHDLEMVIMDEVHYINDESRGHIWEQLMIFLPKQVQLVMLSATVHNTLQFAEWLGRIRNTEIQVITTRKRPVPLEVFVFLAQGRSQLSYYYKILDQKKGFLDYDYTKAQQMRIAHIDKTNRKYTNDASKRKFNKEMAASNFKKEEQKKNEYMNKNKSNKFKNNDLNPDAPAKKNQVSPETVQWLAFFEFLQKQNSLPVICFVFSRKKIQATIDELQNLDFITSKNTKKYIRNIFNSVIRKKLTDKNDRKLPQVIQTCDILQRGLAMHHAGMLPILKEIVEVLFSNGLVQVLFATETFAVGVNMPARTVAFDEVVKFDGYQKGRRYLKPEEFTQMAGRAGRRGLDKIGSVFIICKPGLELIPKCDMATIVTGKPCSLQSRFKITYNMILILFRNRVFNVKHMLRCSFIEAARLKNQGPKEQEVKEISSKLSECVSGSHTCSHGCDMDSIQLFYNYCIGYEEFLEKRDLRWRWDRTYKIPCGQLLLLDSRGIPDLDQVLQDPNSTTEPNIRRIIPCLMVETDNVQKHLVVFTMGLTYNEETGKFPSGSIHRGFNHRFGIPIIPGSDLYINKEIQYFKPQILKVKPSAIFRICNGKLSVTSSMSIAYLAQPIAGLSILKDPTSYMEKVNTSIKTLKACLEMLCGSKYLEPANIESAKLNKNLIEFFEYPELDKNCSSVINCPDVLKHFQFMYEFNFLSKRLEILKTELSDDSLTFLPEYNRKVKLLNDLEYLYDDSKRGFAKNDTIRLKGRIACEIESHELAITEFLLSGKLQHYSDPANVAAALSCIMFENKITANCKFETKFSENDELIDMVNSLKKVVNGLNYKIEQGGINEKIELNYSLVDTVYSWTKGCCFGEAMENLLKSDETRGPGKKTYCIQFGDVIRCLQRICETLRHCESAAQVMADHQLIEMFKRTKNLVYRGVVCTQSIYMDESSITSNIDMDDDIDLDIDTDKDDDWEN